MTKLSKFILFFFVSLCLACLIGSQVSAATVINISNSGIQSQDGNTAKGWYGSSRDSMGFNYRYNIGSWIGNNLGFYFEPVSIPKGTFYTTISVQYKANTGSQIYANTTSMVLANGFNNTNAICQLNPSFTDSGNGLVYYYNVICDIPSTITINNYRFNSSAINGLSIFKNGIVSSDTDEIYSYLSTINSSILGQNSSLNSINTNIQNQSTQQHNDSTAINNNITNTYNFISSDTIESTTNTDSISSQFDSNTNNNVLNFMLIPINFVSSILDGFDNECNQVCLGNCSNGGFHDNFNFTFVLPCLDIRSVIGNDIYNTIDALMCVAMIFAFIRSVVGFAKKALLLEADVSSEVRVF